MVYWTSPCNSCIDHIPKVFFQYLFFQKSYHIKTIVPSETKFWGFFQKIIIFIYMPQLCWFASCFSCNWIIWEHNARYIRIRQEALRKLSRGKVDTKVKQILAHFGRCALPATTVKQTLAKFRWDAILTNMMSLSGPVVHDVPIFEPLRRVVFKLWLSFAFRAFSRPLIVKSRDCHLCG